MNLVFKLPYKGMDIPIYYKENVKYIRDMDAAAILSCPIDELGCDKIDFQDGEKKIHLVSVESCGEIAKNINEHNKFGDFLRSLNSPVNLNPRNLFWATSQLL